MYRPSQQVRWLHFQSDLFLNLVLRRVSYETLNQHSQAEIGYQIRFEKKKTDKTKVLFLTEGLLLRQISADPSLSSYDVIVLDEVKFLIILNS